MATAIRNVGPPDTPADLLPSTWRWRFAGGFGLIALLLVAALALVWYEHRSREQEVAAQAELVVDGIARRVQERTRLLAGRLRAFSVHGAAGLPSPGRIDPSAQAAMYGMLEVHVDPVPAGGPTASAGTDPVVAAEHLQLLPPEPGATELDVVWTGTPGVRTRARVSADWWAQVVQGLGLPERTIVTLVHEPSQRIYVRSRDHAASLGRSLSGSRLFSARHRGRRTGSYLAPSVLDGEYRQSVYQRIDGTPLVAVVATPHQQIAALAAGFVATVLAVALLLGAMWWWLLRVFNQSELRQARLLQAQVADRERLRQAQDIARIGDWVWDLASGRIRWSRTMYDIYGLDPQTFTPDADSAFAGIHPEDRPRVQAVAAAMAEGGMPCQAEFRIVRPDGGERVLSVRGARETSADGRLLIRCVQQDVTELAQARERLHRTEQQYRFLFEHNPVPMWVYDPATLRLLAVNRAMQRHYGYTSEELLAMSILDIRPQADHARVAEAAHDPGPERPQGEVWTHLRQDGSALRMAIYTTDIDFEGSPARLVAAQDVTERELNEQRFRMVARATSDGIYDYDIVAGSLWWSAGFYAAFDLQPAQVGPTLQGWEALVHPEDLGRVSASLERALDDPAAESWEEEYRFRRGDGSYADVVDRGFFARDPAGRAIRMVGGMLDVSEKRRREGDLRLLSRVVEAASNGITIVDAHAPDMPLVYVNRAFEQMTGYPAAECLGRNCRFLQGGDFDQHGVEGIRHALQAGREARVLLRNYRRDGSMFWNELYVAPVLDDAGHLTHFVGILTDVSEEQRYQQELAHRATHDALTGLPNRQLLHDRLQQAILNADRYGRKAVVVFLDLDDFKLVNDSLDHAAGDEALRIVANRLQAQIRGTDTIGRFGGDEFVVVLTEQAQEDGVGQVTARLMRAISAPMEIGGSSYVLTSSIGWACYPDDGGDADTLLKHADIAMYQAKRAGRNRAERYRAHLDVHVSQRLHLVGQLRAALERREFRLAFQPLYDTAGRVAALEALVRWQHPERGLLLPGEFVGVCEESGLIMELGRRTLREAARHHRLLADHGLGHVRIAVNVSAMQFGAALERDVADVLSEFRLPSGVLELEVTESVVMEHPEIAIETMRRIADLGVCIAIDDFGTGYSSLAYLKRLPLDRLKIDRTFVRDLPHDRDAASICDAILQLARSLELGTVAEGVETPEQLQWLRSHGCDEIQGYLLARPAPFDDILASLGAGVGAA